MSTSNDLTTTALEAFRSMISASAATSMTTALEKEEAKKSDGEQITDDDVKNVKSSVAVKNACKKAKDQLEGERKRVPKGLYDMMDELRGQPKSATRKEIDRKRSLRGPILEALGKVDVHSVFMEAIERFSINDWNEFIPKDSKRDIRYRTASCPFNSIIKKDIANRADILSRLQTAAIDCTDLYSNMCTIVYINMLRYAVLDENATRISINELVPRGLDKSMFDQDDVKVTTYPESPQADTKLIFTHQHLHYLYSNHFKMGSRESTHTNYPIWQTIMGEVTKEQSSTMSYTAHEVIQRLATNLSNMYEDGKLIRRLLDNLLKVLLDIHLHASDNDDIDITNLAIEAPLQVHEDTAIPVAFDDLDTAHVFTTTSSTLMVPVVPSSMLVPAEEQGVAVPEPISAKDEMGVAFLECPQEDQKAGPESSPTSRRFQRQRIRDTLRMKKREQSKLEKLVSPSDSQMKRLKAVKERIGKLEAEYASYRNDAKERRLAVEENIVASSKDVAEEIPRRKKERGASALLYGPRVSKARSNKLRGFLKKTCMQKAELDRAGFESIWDGDPLSAFEMDTIIGIYHILRPLLRHVYATNCSLASQIPFCYLANKILIATGNKKLSRALIPFPSIGDIHALPITATTLLEMVGDLLEKTASVTIENANDDKEKVLSFLFNIDKVNEACEARGLVSAHRITMTDHGMARILGVVKDTSRLAPTYKPTPQSKPTLSLSKQEIANEMNKINDALKGQSKEIDEKKEAYASLLSQWDKKRMDLGNHFNPKDDDCVRAQKEVRELKQQLHDQQYHICLRDEEMRVQKKKKSTLKTALNASAKPRQTKKDGENEKVVLTAGNMRCLAPSHTVDISLLHEEEKQLGFIGVDYGFHTLSTSVPMLEEHVSAHLDLISSDKKPTTEDSAFHALVKPVTTNNDTIAYQTGELRRRRRLETRKKENADVFKAETQLASVSISTMVNEDHIRHANEIRETHKDTLRGFYHDKYLTREKRRQEYSVQKWKDRVLSFERKCLKEALVEKAEKSGTILSSAIFMIGGSGMGYGSTIKGFMRYGGKWLRVKHSYNWPVLVVDEYRTSQVCAFCGWQIQRPRTANKKKSQGGCLCINPKCVSFLEGRASSGRDTMAATNIGVKGVASTKGQIINGMERNIGSFLLASKL